ncbi:MAG TPA: DEAD/DEAH box helicase family protein [Phenylobacterium sp.]
MQALIGEALTPLYLETGSIAAVTKVLNDALEGVGETRPLHPNRIHALLSDDVARGVNELTVDLLQRAVQALLKTGRLPSDLDVASALAALATKAQPLLHQQDGDFGALARRLGAPPAILQQALDAAHIDRSERPGAAGADPARTHGPDWSYQDVAVARCLDALRRRPTGNIGLILPTGAGKTRTALRIILETLDRTKSETAQVIWVTHRKTLKAQAFRELDRLLETAADILPDAARTLAGQVTFAMVGELEGLLASQPSAPALVVVDEAHHAAAISYRPVFESPHRFPVLLLTATPNRTDKLPIGIDEIAYTITYRELAERGAIIVPKFEPFPVEDFEWSTTAIDALAARLALETEQRFSKTLVLTQRLDQVTAFYEAFVARIETDDDHPLKPDDVGFIHGTGNSHGLDNEDFLARFAAKPRAVLVAAQMLLEGFDDPAIDAVVITYKTDSVIKLMQAAGRCVRYAPRKTAAYVLQADNPSLAYRFDQRWLYQEIDDYLRPDLRDEDYSDQGELLAHAADLLEAHHVSGGDRATALRALAKLAPGASPRLLFYGLPYFGDPADFEMRARWGVFIETPENSVPFRGLFNSFSALGAELSDPTEYLTVTGPAHGISRDRASAIGWSQMVDVLTAAYFARQELYGPRDEVQAQRPFKDQGPTTWLRYVVLHHRPQVPTALLSFLSDCHNRAQLEATYLDSARDLALAVKTPLPLGGCEGLLLAPDIASETLAWLDNLRDALRLVDPSRQLSELAARQAASIPPRLPLAHLALADRWISEAGRRAYCLPLEPLHPPKD